ncbi:MAG: VOC family protein [Chromatiales bacterium]|nr:VOC family protein [Chromatiales bacterium]
MPALDALHHVAIQVEDLDRALDWYRQHFRLEVVYRDPTWALLRLANIHLALVIPAEHPPHLALSHPDAARFGALTTHRDGTRSVYIQDSEGNTVEIMQAGAGT